MTQIPTFTQEKFKKKKSTQTFTNVHSSIIQSSQKLNAIQSSTKYQRNVRDKISTLYSVEVKMLPSVSSIRMEF